MQFLSRSLAKVKSLISPEKELPREFYLIPLFLGGACLSPLASNSQLYLLFGVPLLAYWSVQDMKARDLYAAASVLIGASILLKSMVFWLQQGKTISLLSHVFGRVHWIEAAVWLGCLSVMKWIFQGKSSLAESKKQEAPKSEEAVKPVPILQPVAEAPAGDKAQKAFVKWDVLVRNSRDGGANSVLACQVLEKTTVLLTENNEQVKQMIQTAALVKKYTDQLSEITEKIRAISVQSKFLSLNVAVQAARIGESGKAFSLVAEQMKGMTDSTENLTRLIDQKLNEVSDQTNLSQNLCGKVGRVFVSIKEELGQFRQLMLRVQELSTSQNTHLISAKEIIEGKKVTKSAAGHLKKAA